jgi:hypothetical protein
MNFMTMLGVLAAIQAGGMCSEADMELYPVIQNGKWGYIDKSGKMKIQPQYDCAWDFSDDMACVQVGLLRGYINTKGEMVLKPQYAMAGPFVNGAAPVCVGARRWGAMMDLRGAGAGLEGRWVTINKEGKEGAAPGQAPKPAGDAAVASIVKTKNAQTKKWFFADKSGKKLSDTEYDFIGDFSEGLFRVVAGGKQGYVDGAGKTVVDAKFDCGWEFKRGLARVMIGRKEGYIDKTGKFVWEPKEDSYPEPVK